MSATSHTATTVMSDLALMIKSRENGSTSRLFSKLGPVIVGFYGGSQLDKESLGGIIQQFADQEAHHQVAQTSLSMQVCRPEMHGSKIFGMFVDTTGDLDAVKTALGAWNNGSCVGTGRGEAEVWPTISVKLIPGKINDDDDKNKDYTTDNIIEDVSDKQTKLDLVRRTNHRTT
ncbi:class V chitinase, putative [Glarea lozoyensis ATCC 20868]|uniref:Class V chitinase, putative n=1 Tax=Glarea lozoyensis (strain ATCC 20868 / MF5171) TaxID=1116229 RepID=S3DRU4_GLAL2|nr:class V chitinase, putative [Glarea lozoyensis ATCC 20868]EPE34691.1 class V chitinase, putative [Glarea lozoyensis ATCC 20868]